MNKSELVAVLAAKLVTPDTPKAAVAKAIELVREAEKQCEAAGLTDEQVIGYVTDIRMKNP